jgi:hypothetical protein
VGGERGTNEERTRNERGTGTEVGRWGAARQSLVCLVSLGLPCVPSSPSSSVWSLIVLAGEASGVDGRGEALQNHNRNNFIIIIISKLSSSREREREREGVIQ